MRPVRPGSATPGCARRPRPARRSGSCSWKTTSGRPRSSTAVRRAASRCLRTCRSTGIPKMRQSACSARVRSRFRANTTSRGAAKSNACTRSARSPCSSTPSRGSRRSRCASCSKRSAPRSSRSGRSFRCGPRSCRNRSAMSSRSCAPTPTPCRIRSCSRRSKTNTGGRWTRSSRRSTPRRLVPPHLRKCTAPRCSRAKMWPSRCSGRACARRWPRTCRSCVRSRAAPPRSCTTRR